MIRPLLKNKGLFSPLFLTFVAMLVVSISHRNDFDGIASASLVVRYASVINSFPSLVSLKDYGDKEKVVDDRLLSLTDASFIISDLSTNVKEIDEIVERIRKLKANRNNIIWVDHHQTTEDIKDKLSSVVDALHIQEGEVTATEVVFDVLYKQNGIEDEYAKRLANLSHQTDMWKFEESVSWDLVELVSYLNYLDYDSSLRPWLTGFVFYLAGKTKNINLNNPLNEEYKRMLEVFRKKKEESLQIVETSLYQFEVSNVKFVVAWSPRILYSSIAADYLMKKIDADVFIIVKEDGNASVRRKNEKVNCAEVAKVFGGGGHVYASGMSVSREKVPISKYPDYARLIENKLREKFNEVSILL
jgi:oligoribonuclease NrnB/cAMP/cGMP phosphodiesterase (DHH superfamily)